MTRHNPFEHSKLRASHYLKTKQSAPQISTKCFTFSSQNKIKSTTNDSDRKIHQRLHLLLVDIEVDVEDNEEDQEVPLYRAQTMP